MLTVIAAVSFASLAAPVTVVQLTQTLMADVGAHKPDAEVARQIAGMELSERLTETTLARHLQAAGYLTALVGNRSVLTSPGAIFTFTSPLITWPCG